MCDDVGVPLGGHPILLPAVVKEDVLNLIYVILSIHVISICSFNVCHIDGKPDDYLAHKPFTDVAGICCGNNMTFRGKLICL